MIEIEQIKGRSVLRGRFRGRLSKSDLSSLVASLSKRDNDEQLVRVLLDWSRIQTWEAGTTHSSLRPVWREMPQFIDRAAIVHEHCWDKQAALLGAMMRVSQASVRSWTPQNESAALAWLMDGVN